MVIRPIRWIGAIRWDVYPLDRAGHRGETVRLNLEPVGLPRDRNPILRETDAIEPSVVPHETPVEFLRRALRQGTQRFILDLGQKRFIGDDGIGQIVSWYSEVSRLGGILVLTGVRPPLARAFKVFQLDGLFPVCDSVDAALAFLDT